MMENTINGIKLAVTAIISFFSYYLGGADTLLKCLIFMICVDYISGVLSAIVRKELSSEVGFIGIVKKVGIFLIVGVAESVQKVTGIEGIRDISIAFYIANEGVSILENWGNIGLPLPKKLLEILKQLNKEGD